MSDPQTLLEVIRSAPGHATAIILPEAGIRVTYQSLRDQVAAMADALGIAGHACAGDRVATYPPNGLPAIVSFLAASVAGTAALSTLDIVRNEVAFYLEDTAAKLLPACRRRGQCRP